MAHPAVPVRQLKLMSPSGVGKFACCPKRLVAEADHPEWEEPSGPAADFGTVCHYGTQMLLEAPPPKAPTAAQIANAKQAKALKACKTVAERDALFDALVTASCTAAVAALPPLPEGVRWVSEHQANLPALLPDRVGKTGNKGFSGSLDLLRSDRSELWDLKFPGDPVTKVEYLYIAQLASYNIITGVPRTGILFVPVGGKDLSRLVIDWRSPGMPELRDSLRGFIEWTDNVSFRKHAWYIPGTHCQYCNLNPKKWKRPYNAPTCPMHQLPELIRLAASSDSALSASGELAPSADDSFLQSLSDNAAAAAGTAIDSPMSAAQRAKLDALAPKGVNLF